MNLHSFTGEGVILHKRNYSEADRILVILTKYYGKITVLAKGVRKPKSRKRGHLEVFNHIKFQISKGKGFPILTEVEIIDSFSKTRKALHKASVAFFMMEIIGRLTREDEKNQELFEYVIFSLKALEKEKNLRIFRANYSQKVLEILGFWPKGKKLKSPDMFLQSIIEREIFSIRVGKKVLS